MMLSLCPLHGDIHGDWYERAKPVQGEKGRGESYARVLFERCNSISKQAPARMLCLPLTLSILAQPSVTTLPSSHGAHCDQRRCLEECEWVCDDSKHVSRD